MYEIISPNMLKTFELCPKKFFFRYEKNISVPVNEDIFKSGKNIHALAAYYLKKQNIDKMETTLNTKEKDGWEFLKQTDYFNYEVINTEYNLTVKIEETYFGGRIDALVKNNDTLYILDYKTGSAPKNPENDFQTIIYMLAVNKFYKTDKIKFVYIDLKNKKNIEINYTNELASNWAKRLKEISEKIKKSSFAPSKKDCERCEYRIICYDKKLSY